MIPTQSSNYKFLFFEHVNEVTAMIIGENFGLFLIRSHMRGLREFIREAD
jgi:hypothetical protein